MKKLLELYGKPKLFPIAKYMDHRSEEYRASFRARLEKNKGRIPASELTYAE